MTHVHRRPLAQLRLEGFKLRGGVSDQRGFVPGNAFREVFVTLPQRRVDALQVPCAFVPFADLRRHKGGLDTCAREERFR